MRSPFARLPVATRVAGAYAAIGIAWIVVSDGLLKRLWKQPGEEWLWESLKGVLFVAVSALIFHTLVRRLVKRYEESEAALRTSDERWKFALEGAGDGVWDWDGETQRTYFSPRWKAMLGYAETELTDRSEAWENRIHPDDRDHVLEQLRQHYVGQTATYRCEHRLRTKSGSYIWVLSRGQIVRRASDGRPLRAIGTHSDISARKDAEFRVRDALVFNNTILHSAPVGILTYRADGQTVSANEAAANVVGGPLDAVLQQNFRTLESWRQCGLLALADRALRENCVVSDSVKLVTSFGRTTWCEVRFTPFQYDGATRLMLIVQDTTQKHAALDQLELLHAALEAAPTGWVVTDAVGTIEWVNPGFTKLTGYSLAEVVGAKPSLLKSDMHSPGFYAHLWATVKAGQIWQGELCNRRKDGSLYYEHMTVAPVRDASGAITHFVAMKEDITGQHELEQQLSRSQRLESIGLIASGIAHDLNNMLAPIMLSIGLIKSFHRDRPTHELLDAMESAAQRGANVVQQVLTFARGVDGERRQLDVRPLLKELTHLVRETFPREIRIVGEVPDAPLLIDGDVTQLHQVLLNLAVNARDAMPDGGVLTLEAQAVTLTDLAARRAPEGRAGNYVKVIVADTGTGIAPEILERIFEPFFTTKPRGKGTGLGLSTVYGIVRSHGGFVDVQSKVGAGTAFAVVLPASVTCTPAIKVTAVPRSRVEGGGRRVLVVDDEASIRLVTSQVLRRSGFAPTEAEDGFEALAHLRERPDSFTAAIVDLMMPGMNGCNLVREIRQLAPALPVIVASGLVGNGKSGEDRGELEALGVQTILTKPFGETDLLEALESAMFAPAATRLCPATN